VGIQYTGGWVHGVEAKQVVAVSKQIWLCSNCKVLDFG
uniref:Uncharacterized protein n=1 Tax=Fusarium oxysporum (strain Fo5176) TaxID=660025 RepID=A0A0D2Y5P1_FUSOF